MSDSQPPDLTPKAASTSDRPPSRPPGRDSSAMLHAALSASGKAEASLSTLMRSIRDLSAGVSGAREANVQLLRELEAMSDLLGAANERQLALKNRVALLEQSLERSQIESSRERAYILDQQDAFIAAMMEDHEQVVSELNRELEAQRRRPSQRPTGVPGDLLVLGQDTDASVKEELDAARKLIDKLVGDRERTRETLLKVQAQRDEAQAALVEISRESRPPQTRITDAVRQALPGSNPALAITSRNAPTLPPPEAARTSSTPQAPPVSAPIPAVLGGFAADDRSTRSTAPQPFTARPKAPELSLSPRDPNDRMSQPPEELRAALHAPSSSADAFTDVERHTPPGPPSVAPATAQTQSGRPGGYSLTNSVAPEHVAGAQHVSRAPRR